MGISHVSESACLFPGSPGTDRDAFPLLFLGKSDLRASIIKLLALTDCWKNSGASLSQSASLSCWRLRVDRNPPEDTIARIYTGACQ